MARLAVLTDTVVDRWRAENAKAPWLDRTTNAPASPDIGRYLRLEGQPVRAPSPTCFADRAILDCLTPSAPLFFERFIAAYERNCT